MAELIKTPYVEATGDSYFCIQNIDARLLREVVELIDTKIETRSQNLRDLQLEYLRSTMEATQSGFSHGMNDQVFHSKIRDEVAKRDVLISIRRQASAELKNMQDES